MVQIGKWKMMRRGGNAESTRSPIGKSCPIRVITNKWRHLQTNPNGQVVKSCQKICHWDGVRQNRSYKFCKSSDCSCKIYKLSAVIWISWCPALGLNKKSWTCNLLKSLKGCHYFTSSTLLLYNKDAPGNFEQAIRRVIFILNITIEDCERQKMCRHLGSAPNLIACHGRVWGQLI